MEKSIITFSANEQALIKTGGIGCYASDTVSYVEAQFTLGENWSGYDSVRAVWFNDYKTISTVLDPDGVCIVPHEVLVNRGKVMVNLVGSILVSGELSDRLTTFPCEALKVSAKAKISGSETAAVTPSQFEQFVSMVISEVEKVTGMTAQAETLPAGSQATARYENGILYLGIPQGIQGERGEAGADGADGNGIASVVYNSDYSLTLVFDNGERFTTPPIRGERGPAGADGRDGTDGVTPNLSVGNVETLEPTQDAYVTRRGTDDNPIFDFGIPRGQDGTVPDLDLILPTDTASGDIVSITDGQSVVPVKSLKVTLEPIQSGSGTPSPDNVRPISGRTECVTEVCGKNFFNGSFNIITPFALHKAVTACASAELNGASYGVLRTYDENQTFIASTLLSTGSGSRRYGNITLSENVRYVKFEASGGTLTDMMIELGTVMTAYEPYQGTTYTTSLGQTVYGGTLDVVTGELVVDRAMVELRGQWQGGSFEVGNNTVRVYFASSLWTPTMLPNNEFDVITIYADKLQTFAPDYIYRNDVMGVSENRNASANGLWVRVDKSLLSEATQQGLADWLAQNPITICYKVKEPQTYQLTPQQVTLLHGTNNVWSDGEVELTYNADVQLWVLKQLGTSGTRTLTKSVALKTETDDTKLDVELTKSDSIQLAED